jgi:NADH dehydrogenase
MKKILILGGTGFVGRHVCEDLARLHWQVTLPTRHAKNAMALQSLPLVHVVEVNVHDEAALTRLVAGHDAVVNLIAILHGDEAAFERAHVELPAKLARACQAAGVKRLVQVSALGAHAKSPQAPPSRYLRSKSRGEAVLQQAGLDLTVLRPSVIFGAGDQFTNMFANLQRVLPFIPLAGAHTRFQPVWVQDVAQAIVRCLQDRRSIGQTFELCGPDTLSLQAIVQLCGRLAGVRQGAGVPVIPMPLWVGRLQAGLMELMPGQPLMSRDNVASLQVDNVASGKRPGLSALGLTPSSLAGIAPGYLGHDSAQGVPTHLVDLRSR